MGGRYGKAAAHATHFFIIRIDACHESATLGGFLRKSIVRVSSQEV